MRADLPITSPVRNVLAVLAIDSPRWNSGARPERGGSTPQRGCWPRQTTCAYSGMGRSEKRMSCIADLRFDVAHLLRAPCAFIAFQVQNCTRRSLNSDDSSPAKCLSSCSHLADKLNAQVRLVAPLHVSVPTVVGPLRFPRTGKEGWLSGDENGTCHPGSTLRPGAQALLHRT